MTCTVTVLPENRQISAHKGQNLLEVLRHAGLSPDAPCGGKGTCGKCRVLIMGQSVAACRTTVSADMTVTLPNAGADTILTRGPALSLLPNPPREGYLLAIDLGTTTVAGCLMDGQTGNILAYSSLPNPQAPFGADVISRIQAALCGQMDRLTQIIRDGLTELTASLCAKAGCFPHQIATVSLVGNSAMQQLFLGIRPDNLAKIPFSPVLTQAKTVAGGDYLPLWNGAQLLIVPDISGFVGADTVACVLATGMDRREELTLLVDIGTNGEMVLGSSGGMVACAAAAGPALEGANIRFGMRGRPGAIDHVAIRDSRLACSVIGGGEAEGICGSGLVDAIAAALELKLINKRGKVLTPNGKISLTQSVYLTQEDIRQVQLAKGAIAAGIRLMAEHLGVCMEDIQQVYLAGAFGTFMDPQSACRMGLLPPELAGRIQAVGNAALSGAGMLALDEGLLDRAQELTGRMEVLELASLPGFRRSFAKQMEF